MESTKSTTKKKCTFLETPMSAVTSLMQVPGVGTATLEKLTKAGIQSPSQLMGYFMMINKDPDAMSTWLQSTCAIRQRESAVIAEALFAKTGRMESL